MNLSRTTTKSFETYLQFFFTALNLILMGFFFFTYKFWFINLFPHSPFFFYFHPHTTRSSTPFSSSPFVFLSFCPHHLFPTNLSLLLAPTKSPLSFFSLTSQWIHPPPPADTQSCKNHHGWWWLSSLKLRLLLEKIQF